MACHVYDTKYYKVMTIALCDMQSKDAKAQELFWTQLNSVMRENGVEDVNFKGFMADSAQANWNAVRKVYGNGDPAVCMEGREHTCLFHWTLCLQRTTTRNIKPEFHDQHKELCNQWKDAKTQEEADTKYNVIKAWWVFSGAATSPSAVRALNDWMAFWQFRYRQWGGYMQLVSHRCTKPLQDIVQSSKSSCSCLDLVLMCHVCFFCRICQLMRGLTCHHATWQRRFTTGGFSNPGIK